MTAQNPRAARDPERDFHFGACFVRIGIDRHWGTRVSLNAGATMTPDEARTLAAALVEFAEVADRG